MSTHEGMPPWNVTMLGPSRVGKTSLLTALRVAANSYFAGTPVTVEPEDEITRDAFAKNDNSMKGELNSRRFHPDSLPGDLEAHQYGLVVDAGVPSHRLTLRFHDYPGGWLSTAASETVRELMEQSPTVIVPIDATLLMAGGVEHSGRIADLLKLTEVADQVRTWATVRTRNGDPTRLILVPVKCETYFNDNGGRFNKADALFARVQGHYAETVQAYREEAKQEAQVLYAPVDTIGPIELMQVRWVEDPVGTHKAVPTYRVRRHSNGATRRREIRGAEPILAHLVKDVLAAQDSALREYEADIQGELDDLKRQRRDARSNWFKAIIDSVSGRSDRRNSKISDARTELSLVDENVRKLAEGVGALSQADWGRVRPWP